MLAKGNFEVNITPQKPDNPQEENSGIARMSIDKTFHGELEAHSDGEMLSFMTSTKGSAGYVAIEHVQGSLQGRKGGFVLQHNATMKAGQGDLNIIVLPDSGTDALAGITGKMLIEMKEGQRSYSFDFSLPDEK